MDVRRAWNVMNGMQHTYAVALQIAKYVQDQNALSNTMQTVLYQEMNLF